MTEMAEMAVNEAGLRLVCSLRCCGLDVGCGFHDRLSVGYYVGSIKQGIFRSFITAMSGVCILVTLDDF
jgi:hypothetical protein